MTLHNNYEIIHNGKTYHAYNTLLRSVYNQIASLKQFTSHIAVGTGTEDLTFEDNKLKQYSASFEAVTEEIQSDVSKGVLYIKKLVEFDQNNTQTFSFSELGLCSSSEFDPEIYNHVLIKDNNGNPISITRESGDILQIRVTIYLELNNDSDAIFIPGENPLIKQILGENLPSAGSNLYVARGENLSPNETIKRQIPTNCNLIKCSSKLETDGQNIQISFAGELGEGATEEILFIFDNQVCVRLNTQNLNEQTTNALVLSSNNNGLIDLGENVASIQKVSKVAQDGNQEETSFNQIKYAKKFTDKLTNLFDQNFNNSTLRCVSKQGNYIGFIQNSYLYLYRNLHHNFEKINTTQVDVSNLFKVVLTSENIVVIRTENPYISVYEIHQNNAIKMQVNYDIFSSTSYPFSFLDIDATADNNNNIFIGMIINNESQTPLVLKLTNNGNGVYYDSIIRSNFEKAVKVFASEKTKYTESAIYFLSNSYQDSLIYLTEKITENEKTFVGSTESSFALLNDAKKVEVKGKYVVSHKNNSPFFEVFLLSDFSQITTDFSTQSPCFISSFGEYVIAKNQTENYNIFNFNINEILTPFETDLEAQITLNNIADFEFLSDTLILFSSENCFGLAIKKSHTFIDNLSQNNQSYLVEFLSYNLLGTKEFEGVKACLNFQF